MTDKPPLWADLLLTVWVLVVAVFFFGVYFTPAVGAWTDAGGGFYMLMVMAAAVTLAAKYLKRNDGPKISPTETRPKTRKKR